MAHEPQGGDDKSDSDSDFIDIDTLLEPEAQLSTTRLGILRLEETLDTYRPGTLPPRLYQTNPFSMQRNDEDLGGDVHELAADTMPATAQEIQQMDDDDANEEALSQAIETVIATTRASRKRTATSKVVDNAVQAQDAKRVKTSGRGGRGHKL
jgi:hypothetical protein